MLSLELPKTSPSQETKSTARILVVEDEPLIGEMIVLALQDEGYEVVFATDGREALNILQPKPQADQELESTQENAFDLLVLDIMLPQVNGLDICRLLRYQGNIVPILIVSAKGTENDRVLGLEVGADDYLTKPFSIKELIARVKALIRRQKLMNIPQASARQFRDVCLFSQECRVLVRGEEVNLSPKEYRLLELFMSYPRRVWSREQLIEQIWGIDFLGDTKTVDVHIRWLREKIEIDPSHPEYLITVRGFGYRFG
jgi:two-component system phosphate regulon response regulator PhoB